MDTKFIQQYGEDICCYRLRTARQKKRKRYQDIDKQLIQLHKKENELYEQIRNLGWEALQPPVQKGWVRYFVLREDVARSSKAAFFEDILKKINTRDFYWRKDFKRKKRRYGRKAYVVKPQFLLSPDECQFQKMQFTNEEKHFFKEVWDKDWKGLPLKRYEFIHPWRYVLKIRPNMIDRLRIKDAMLESELQVLENYIERNDLRKRQGKVVHGYYKHRYYRQIENYKEKNAFKGKSLLQILDLIKT